MGRIITLGRLAGKPKDGIIRELNAANYTGPLSVEWEDTGMNREAGAAESCEFVRRINFSASAAAFDSALKRD